MKVHFGPSLIELVIGNLAEQPADALVNSARSDLLPGGDVDHALHRAAGPTVRDELRRRYPLGCPVGDAVVSAAGQLPVRYLFHAVGPNWNGGRSGETDLLRSACLRCLELAIQNNCLQIAFPAIATGVFRFPVDVAAEHLLDETRRFLASSTRALQVRFVLADAGTYAAFARVLDSYAV